MKKLANEIFKTERCRSINSANARNYRVVDIPVPNYMQSKYGFELRIRFRGD